MARGGTIRARGHLRETEVENLDNPLWCDHERPAAVLGGATHFGIMHTADIPTVRPRPANPAKGGVGQPLPAGLVRFYQADSKQRLQLVGEESIAHTPVGELATVELGKAFDVLARKTQTKWHSTPNYQEANYEVVLTNRKNLTC